MAERVLVRSIDADDTLVDRGPLLRAWGLAVEKARRRTHKAVSLDSIPQMGHAAIDIPVKSIPERLFLIAHSRRKLLNGVSEALSESLVGERHSKNIVNTGRSNKLEWTRMTVDQFTNLGIDPYFLRYTFKPSGVSSTASKLDVIRQLIKDGNDVEHYDDDPRTALVIADAFPNVTVNLLHHTLTGMMIPREQLIRPNLHIVSHIGEGITRK